MAELWLCKEVGGREVKLSTWSWYSQQLLIEMRLQLAMLHVAHLDAFTDHATQLPLVVLQLHFLQHMMLLGDLQLRHCLGTCLAQFGMILELQMLHLLHDVFGIDVRQVLCGLDLLILLLQLIFRILCGQSKGREAVIGMVVN